jgi:hypothetical protein
MGLVVMGSERTSFEVTQRLRRLWIAVLYQAIEDARGNVRSAENQDNRIGGNQREALTWIFNGIPGAANSFDSICILLDIDPDWARHRLRLVPGIRRGLESAGLHTWRGEGEPC